MKSNPKKVTGLYLNKKFPAFM